MRAMWLELVDLFGVPVAVAVFLVIVGAPLLALSFMFFAYSGN